jgi:hypothetical protein
VSSLHMQWTEEIRGEGQIRRSRKHRRRSLTKRQKLFSSPIDFFSIRSYCIVWFQIVSDNKYHKIPSSGHGFKNILYTPLQTHYLIIYEWSVFHSSRTLAMQWCCCCHHLCDVLCTWRVNHEGRRRYRQFLAHT